MLIAIFDSLGDEDLVDYTNRVFSAWKIGKRGKDNGVLLALYWKDHKARIEVGYGLEPLLTDAKSKQILSDFLIPELKAGQPDRALSLSALEILRTIESPLIASGRAEQILRADGFKGGLQPAAPTTSSGTSSFWVLAAIILFIFVINRVSSADAHFTRSGWYRPRPRIRRGGWGGPFIGGGGFGGGFGSGGFSGGGGSSGGGGASGSW